MTDLLAYRTKPPRADAEGLQRAIVAHLMLRGHPDAIWYHPMNNAPVSKRTAGRFKALGVRAGVPDLCFIRSDGTPAYIELKAPGGRMSPEQKAFQAKCVKIGVDHAVIADIDTAIATLEGWGVLR